MHIAPHTYPLRDNARLGWLRIAATIAAWTWCVQASALLYDHDATDGFGWTPSTGATHLDHNASFRTPDAHIDYGNFSGTVTSFGDAPDLLRRSSLVEGAAWHGMATDAMAELQIGMLESTLSGVQAAQFVIAWTSDDGAAPIPLDLVVWDYGGGALGSDLRTQATVIVHETFALDAPQGSGFESGSIGVAGVARLRASELFDDDSGDAFTAIDEIWIQIGAGLDAATGRAFAFDLASFAVLAPEPVDFNYDGLVDGGDLVRWERVWGRSALADVDNDGDSDGFDFLSWQQVFGTGVAGAGSRAGLQSLPEPATLAASAAALLAGLPSLRGRRKMAAPAQPRRMRSCRCARRPPAPLPPPVVPKVPQLRLESSAVR
ncbi:MAG: hypothetical protein KDA61_14725 [Planctomycetales bacterium]|nr:hypothetical protein [Planctomycetales bacterium]